VSDVECGFFFFSGTPTVLGAVKTCPRLNNERPPPTRSFFFGRDVFRIDGLVRSDRFPPLPDLIADTRLGDAPASSRLSMFLLRGVALTR